MTSSPSDSNTKERWAGIIGFSIMLASLQFSIGSVEMSSKFSIASFAKDQDTLQRAADALRLYFWVACIWTLSCGLVLFGAYGWWGAIFGVVANVLIMLWICGSYIHSFRDASRRHNLKMPTIFKFPWSPSLASDEDKMLKTE